MTAIIRMVLIPQGCRSSRGVLLALRNAASFYQGGKVVNVAGPGENPRVVDKIILCQPESENPVPTNL